MAPGKLPLRVAQAFAPGAISNFFSARGPDFPRLSEHDFSQVGATGGGFTLSAGVLSKASLLDGPGSRHIRISVNGDSRFDARTTSLALRLLLEATGVKFGTVILEQNVEVPIGLGFGASAASALSGVIAASSVLKLEISKKDIADFAHAAEIISQTGLGTVSVIYDGAGAGVITSAGGPGVARFQHVKIPRGLKLVTASLAPYQKRIVLSSRAVMRKAGRLGAEALSMVRADPSLLTLLAAGEWFASKLGLETREVSSLLRLANANGAIHPSQNMIGYAIHAAAYEEDVPRLVTKLGSNRLYPLVQVHDFGATKAGLIRSLAPNYPTVASSLL